MTPWLESATQLLSEPDPGPTPFLVDRLAVDPSILAMVGPPKAGKTWALLEMAVAISTGTPAFGFLEVKRGPVVLILEESGRKALHRRLSQLCRGRGTHPEELGDLHFAANQRVKLTDSRDVDSWPDRIRTMVRDLAPVAVFFDPLARVKGSSDENSQQEMAPALDFMRELRDLGQCTVGFVHHTGHGDQARMRGTSDLESFWESKLTLREGRGSTTLTAEHREADNEAPIKYRLSFDSDSRTVRFDVDSEGPADVANELLDFLANHPESTFPEVREGIGRRKEVTRSQLDSLIEAGTAVPSRSHRRDRRNRNLPVEVYSLASRAGSTEVPDSGTEVDLGASDPTEEPGSPLYRRGTRTGVPQSNGSGVAA